MYLILIQYTLIEHLQRKKSDHLSVQISCKNQPGQYIDPSLQSCIFKVNGNNGSQFNCQLYGNTLDGSLYSKRFDCRMQ